MAVPTSGALSMESIAQESLYGTWGFRNDNWTNIYV